jgi:hypothetical protein
LGEDVEELAEVIEVAPITIEERVQYLENMMKHHTNSLDSLFTILKDHRKPGVKQVPAEQIDKEIEGQKAENKIPTGTVLVGTTKGVPFFLAVKEDGFYVGINKFNSLSSAAQGVSGVRRSGLSFWRFGEGKFEGKTVREVYKGA